METVEIPPHSAAQKKSLRPYRSSWIDSLVKWVEAIPGPSAVFYFGLLFAVCVLNNVVLWLVGTLPVGSFDPLFTFASIYVVYSLAFYHYLKGVASKSLHGFYPALGETISREETLEYKMTHLPASWGFLALFLGTPLGLYDAYSTNSLMNVDSVMAITYSGIMEAFGFSTFLALMFQTTRQLYFVINLHNQVTAIDLFNLKPLRSFSKLTARAGFAVFFLAGISAIIYSEDTDPSLLALYVGIVIIGLLIFIVPLISMRAHINEEKSECLTEIDQRLKQTLNKMHKLGSQNDPVNLNEISATIALIEKEKSIVKGISSYPWDPATLQSFFSTILIPLLLWWIKYMLEKWF